MLKIGVLGAGHLGKIHINLIKEIKDLDLVGFFDPSEEKTEYAKKEFDIKSFTSINDLVDAVDAVDIVTPTLSHFECALHAIKNGKHAFIEKPMTNTLAEAQELLTLSEEANVKIQVGHVERFNPALKAALKHLKNPMFIEAHRLSPFNVRGTDVSVILDLMIHDIDIVLSLVDADVKRISANGVAVISDSPDIANARIEFANGCVANLTASRISLKKMRKMRVFQQDSYCVIDFANKKTEVFKIHDEDNSQNGIPNGQVVPSFMLELGDDKKKKLIEYKTPAIEDYNAIKYELELFYRSVNENTEPIVSVIDGYKALKVADEIVHDLEEKVLI